MNSVSLARPDISNLEKHYVQDAISSGWISSVGPYIEKFEHQLGQLFGAKYALSANNGTTALHLALVAAGIGPGDEVIVPTLTYIASANAVRYVGATPVFIDSSSKSLNLDESQIQDLITSKTKAVIAVHLYGVPANLSLLRSICDLNQLVLIEDCAEAHGATFEDKYVGTIGDIGVFSFFGNKILSTGEGGAILTNNKEYADKIKLYRGQGMDPERRYWFPVVGYNYRMTNIAAAIGLAQVERFQELLGKRRALSDSYYGLLTQIEGCSIDNLEFLPESVPWLRNVFLSDPGQQNSVMKFMASQDVETRPVFIPMHKLPPYLNLNSDYSRADHWSARGISLPLHTGMDHEDVEKVATTLSSAIRST